MTATKATLLRLQEKRSSFKISEFQQKLARLFGRRINMLWWKHMNKSRNRVGFERSVTRAIRSLVPDLVGFGLGVLKQRYVRYPQTKSAPTRLEL